MSHSLTDTRIAIIGGGSGIGPQITRQALAIGADVVLAGRRSDALLVPDGGGSVQREQLDLGDEASIDAFAQRVGALDHVVSLAADHANGPLGSLTREAVDAAFAAKVIGPLRLAGRLAGQIRPGGSLLLFSGVAAWRPAPGLAVMATTNGAVDFMARALAVDLAPVRVNAISPGIVDSGAWDGMGAERDRFFADTAQRNPARRIGTPADIADAALLALANPFVTGTTLHVDGGGRLA